MTTNHTTQPEAFIATWTEMQKRMWQGFFDAAQTASGAASTPSQAQVNPADLYLRMSEGWRALAQEGLRAWQGGAPTPTRALENLASSQEAALNLAKLTAETWLSLVPQSDDPQAAVQAAQKAAQEVQQRLLAGSQSLANLAQSSAELWTTYLNTLQKAGMPWLELLKDAQANPPQSVVGAPWEALQRTLAPFLRAPAFGYTREYETKLRRAFEAWLEVQHANLEYQTLMAEISGRAVERLFTDFAERAGRGETVRSYKELVARWVDTADAVFLEAFVGERYIKAQGRLLNTAMAYRLRERDLQEVFLEAQGLPTRSEVDEAHKAIYELRKEVRALKRSLKEARGEVTELTQTYTDEPLPEDFPERDALINAGITKLASLPHSMEGLMALEGIGKVRAERILSRLKGRA